MVLVASILGEGSMSGETIVYWVLRLFVCYAIGHVLAHIVF